MDSNKIIRSICYFSDKPSKSDLAKIDSIADQLSSKGFVIQTKRLCSAIKDIKLLEGNIPSDDMYLSVGSLTLEDAQIQLSDFFDANNTSFNIDLTSVDIEPKYADLLFEIIKNKPGKTFLFTFVFNNKHSAPYFPSATYGEKGFSIGLQPTDLSENCRSVEEWLDNMKEAWLEIAHLFHYHREFLGIDSSTAPLLGEKGSLVAFINRLGYSFSHSVTTDIYLRITNFIKANNPKPVGLCGLMFPCLEDTYLANEYEKGNFSIERNIYLSLHCGLGIDTYPIGVDEKPERVIEILKLLQALSNKYQKPLSCRFVSDGKAKIGEKTNFKNQYLKDVILRKL